MLGGKGRGVGEGVENQAVVLALVKPLPEQCFLLRGDGAYETPVDEPAYVLFVMHFAM